MWLLGDSSIGEVSVSSTRIDHDARGLTARGALFTTKRVSFFWAVVSQLSRGFLEGVRPYRLVGGVVTLARTGGPLSVGEVIHVPRTRKAKELIASPRNPPRMLHLSTLTTLLCNPVYNK